MLHKQHLLGGLSPCKHLDKQFDESGTDQAFRHMEGDEVSCKQVGVGNCKFFSPEAPRLGPLGLNPTLEKPCSS